MDSVSESSSKGKEVVPYGVSDTSTVNSDSDYADSEASTVTAGNEVVAYESDTSSTTVIGDEVDDVSDVSTLSAHDEVMPYMGVVSDRESPEPEDTRQFPCPDCHRRFPTQDLLDSHHRDKHNRPKNKHKRPARPGSPLDREVPGPSTVKAYPCPICKDILKTRRGYLAHMRSHTHRYDCKMCASSFDTVDDRDRHMSMEHPWCRICDLAFTNLDEYLRHKAEVHPANQRYDGDLPEEPEDDMGSDEDDLDVEDRQFHKHINCVTIDKFLEIRELINQNKFDTLASDEELLDALQIIFKGVIKGYIPICSSQRLVLTRPMKKLMYTFGTNPSATLLMRNKLNLKQLFNILWESINVVITSFMKYDK